MSNRVLKAFKEMLKAEYERNVRPHVRALIERGNISLAEYKEFRGNSWEHEAIVPALSIEALLAATEHCLANCSRARSPALTYDESIRSVYAPELLKRLRAQGPRVKPSEIPAFTEIAKYPPSFTCDPNGSVEPMFTITQDYIARWHAGPDGKPELRAVIPAPRQHAHDCNHPRETCICEVKR